MFCPNCGAPAEEKQTNCAKCGASLTQQASQTSQPNQSRTPGIGFGIASMVLGIVSLVLFCIIYLAIPCAVVGIVLGGVAISKAKKANTKSGMAIAGLTCSCIALGILIVLIITVGASGLAIASLFS